MNVLIYTVGDREHGMGHVMRSLVLADALVARGVGVKFLTPFNTPGLERIGRSRHAMIAMDAPLIPTLLARGDLLADCLIVDLEHGPTRSLLTAARPHYSAIVTLGGVGFPVTEPDAAAKLVDLQVYQSVLVDPPNGGRALAGIQWLCVDPRYTACEPDDSGHVVVVMGGADPHGMTEKAVNALAASDVLAVLGPAYDGDIEAPDYVQVMRGPDNLLDALDGAGLCVCALGMTAYEAMAAGVPVICTNWSDDHARTAMDLQRRGVLYNLGLWSDFSGYQLRMAAGYVISRWGDYSRAGRQLVDGHGAGRVAGEICTLIRATSSAPATA